MLVALVLAGLSGCQRSVSSTDTGLRIEVDANRRPQARVGLPAGQDASRSRNGAWAPVYVKLKAGKEPVPRDALRLVVESTDSEDSPYRYVTPIPNLAPGEDHFAISYIRPGTGGSECKVLLETTAGRVIQSTAVSRDAGGVLGPRDQLYVAVGSRLPGLRRALVPEKPKRDEEAAQPLEEDPEDRGARRVASLDSVQLMPDRWFGYDAADVVILTTGSESFLKQLLDAPEAPQRRKALAEWVRRGGKLVVSVGHNHQLAAAVLEQMPLPEADRMPLLDCAIGAGAVRNRLSEFVHWTAPAQHQRVALEKVEVAGLKPGPDVHVIAAERPEPRGDETERPVLLQASCGLGRVVLVGIDLDTAPFGNWPGQGAFWNRLLGELAPRTDTVGGPPGMERPELGTELRRTLENSLGVTPVSFGWVALFILLYIVLVGPLDYLILKKVFKRLEWTWITFPVVVVGVSLAAYFTAYAMKGEDLRVNKVDLVEMDLHTPQVYGAGWFTLYSPRIQNYTVGLEPAWPRSSTLLTVLDDPERAGRNGSQGVFSRPYEYAADAGGVERLAVPVWATRTFAASWRAPLPAGAPTVTADLDHARGDEIRQNPPLRGRITNQLPFDLHDVVLFYRERWYPIPGGTLPAGGFCRIDNLELGGPKGTDLPSWFRPRAAAPDPVADLVRPLLFQPQDRQAGGRLNSGLRRLDQQWRLVAQPGPVEAYREEVVLVGRAKRRQGRAEALTAEAAMPTRLWLGELPTSGATRPSLPGLLTQDTFVRVYIPVRHDR